jgi:hypothetical protein
MYTKLSWMFRAVVPPYFCLMFLTQSSWTVSDITGSIPSVPEFNFTKIRTEVSTITIMMEKAVHKHVLISIM